MDKHILSLYDDTAPADLEVPRGSTIESLHTEPWQGGSRRWRGWPVMGIGAVALGLVAGMNHYLRRAPPAAPADVVAAAPQTTLPAPSIDRSTAPDPAVDKPVDSHVDKPVGKSVDKSAEARPAPKPAPAAGPKAKPAEAAAPQAPPREPATSEPVAPSTQLSAPPAPPAAQPDPPQLLPSTPAQAPTTPSSSGE